MNWCVFLGLGLSIVACGDDGGSGSGGGGGNAPICEDNGGSCPTLNLKACPDSGETFCDCEPPPEGVSCTYEYDSPNESCGGTMTCVNGRWTPDF